MPDAIAFALAILLAVWGFITLSKAINGRNGFDAWVRLVGWIWAFALFAAAYAIAPIG